MALGEQSAKLLRTCSFWACCPESKKSDSMQMRSKHVGGTEGRGLIRSGKEELIKEGRSHDRSGQDRGDLTETFEPFCQTRPRTLSPCELS